MKKFTFLLSLLLAFVGVTASAQGFKISDAPNGENWAANTQWYLIKTAATDEWHPTAGYLSTDAAYISNTDIRTDIATLPTNDNGLWCIVGNESSGYKIYNKAEGTSKVLGFSAASSFARMYETSAEGVTSDFDLASSTYATTPWAGCVKKHGTNAWLNNANKNQNRNLCCLGTWENSASTTALLGNAFYFIPVNNVEEASTAVETFVKGQEHFMTMNRYKVIPGVSDACSSEDAAYTKNPSDETFNSFIDAAKKHLAKTYFTITNCRTNYSLRVLSANTTNATALSVDEKKSNASALWQFVPIESGFKLYNANAKAYLGALVGTSSNTSMNADLEQGGLYSISVNTNGTVEGFVLRDGNNGRMNLEGDGRVDAWEGIAGYYNQVTWTIDPATEIEVALNTLGSKSYATTYLPFGVSAVKDAKAYSAATPADGQTVMTEVTSFAKENGILLVSDNAAAKAVLTIGDVEGAASSSALQGTLLAKDITDAQTKYLVFGKNKVAETEVGFFEPTATTIPANRAFFMDTTGSSIALNFGNVTAVNNVVAGNANANAPIFDLSGRRVVKAVKGGLYIQNGKKYIVK